MDNKSDPINGNVIPVFFSYALPSVLGMLALSSAYMVDGIFVGNYVGAHALAAVNLSMPVWSGLFAIILMLAVGGSVTFGKFVGAGNYCAASDIFSKSMACALFFALATCILGLLFLDELIIALGATDALKGMVASYLTIILLFSPLFLMGNALVYFVRVDGSPVLASSSLIFGAILNVALDWLFIVKMDMGIEGAAYGTGISESVVLFILLPRVFRPGGKLKFGRLSGSWENIKKTIANGFSDFANEISVGLTILLFNWIMITRLDVEGVAAFTIISDLFFVGLMVYYGIAESLQPLVSTNFGAGQAKKMAHFLTAALLSIFLISLVICSLLLLIPEFLIGLFLKPGETATVDIALHFIYYFWPAFLFSGINITLTAYFTACHKPIQSASIALSRSLVFPCLLLITLPGFLGDTGIFIAVPIAEFVTFLLALKFMLHNKPSRLVSADAVN